MSLDGVFVDLRQAVRALRRSRSLSFVVVATLGLPIAASVAAFSVLDAVLLEPLPYRDPERVLYLRHRQTASSVSCSVPTFLDYRRGLRSFASLDAVRPADFNVASEAEPERVRALLVTASFFDTMGIAAARGRTFLPIEDQPGHERVAVVSHRIWQQRFAGDPAAVGRTLRLDGAPYTVVGILPPDTAWGRAYGREAAADLWIPLALTPAEMDEKSRGSENLDVYGRLRPGASLGEAQAELDTIVAGLRERHPRRYTVESGFRVVPVPIREEQVGGLRQGLVLITLAVAALLLAAAANVAGLLLARGASRRHETLVRSALGASRARLAREVLAEALVLAAVAGALGVGLAAGVCEVLESIDRSVLPRSQPIAVSPLVAAFAVLATLAVAAVSGALPAWHATRGDLTARARGALGGRETARARRVLIVAQTAVACTLLVGAGLLIRSLAELQRVAPGYRTEDLLTAAVRLPQEPYASAPRRARLAEDVLERVAGDPRVRSAGVVSEAPLGGSRNSGTFAIEGRATPAGTNPPHSQLWSASPGYFATIGIALRSGRVFDVRDDAEAAPVALINETLARRYFAGEDPLGRRVAFQGLPGAPVWREVVGVVGDVRDRTLDREPTPQLYVPYAQRPTFGYSVLVHTSGDPRNAVPIVREALRAADPALPLFDVMPMAGRVADTTRHRRAGRDALAAFAAASLLLSALGLYGLLAQDVRERVPEIGLRMALGADRPEILRMVLASGGRLLAWGVLLGALAGLGAGRLLNRFLYGVAGGDPATFLGVAGVLLATGLLASAIPAWRAARVDPLTALRWE